MTKFKKTKVGQVTLKLNERGAAKEKYAVTKYNHDLQISEKTGETKERSLYCMTYQPKNKMFKQKNNYLDLDSFKAVSYNWWTYMLKIKNKVVFNNHNYSKTTNKHQGEMRQLLNQLGIKVYLFVDMRESLSLESFKNKSLEPMYKKIIQLEIELARKGSKPESNKWRKASIRAIKRDIIKARKLGAKYTLLQEHELRVNMESSETTRVEDMQAKSKAIREARQAAKAAYSQGDVFAVNF